MPLGTLFFKCDVHETINVKLYQDACGSKLQRTAKVFFQVEGIISSHTWRMGDDGYIHVGQLDCNTVASINQEYKKMLAEIIEDVK